MFSSNRLHLSIKTRGIAALSCSRLAVLGGILGLAVAPLWGQSSLGRIVVVGDSLSAGFQNFSLYDSDSAPGIPAGGQKHGYAALIAQQAGANLNLPLISFPGLPPALTIDASGNITRGTSIGTRENPTIQTLDLSVPGYTVADALARSINVTNVTNPIDGLALQVLGFPGLATQTPPCGALGFQNGILTLSEVACAVQLQPTTILVSIGNNDALQSLTLGAAPTPLVQFAASYDILLGALATTRAKIVVSNIPDVTSVPFLVPAPVFLASCHFLPPGVSTADFLVPNLVDQTQSSFNICSSYAVRSASLIAQAQSAVTAYNAIITQAAQRFGAVVVDVNGVLRQISQSGYVVGGRRLTAGFLGGIFSLDGIHPTNTGYAILANAVIRRMNTQLDANIPLISVESVAKTDPLIF